MGLAPGTSLGPYSRPPSARAAWGRSIGPDTRLDRVVAIKVLPDPVAADGEARLRLEREARVISSLTHSHICTLYDIGTHGGETHSGEIVVVVNWTEDLKRLVIGE